MSDPDPPRTGWEDVYRSARPEELPWFSAQIDPDLDDALKRFDVKPHDGPILDLGTGPGTAAIEFARRGYRVTALDVSASAIRMAKERAGPLAAKIDWVRSDLFAKSYDACFQLVHDRGVYHSLGGDERNRYPDVVGRWLRPGGFLFLKTFSTDEPGHWGPHRITRKELEANLGSRLDFIHIEASRFPGTLDHSPKAWFAVFQRPVAPDA